jgi:hypothetical protein
MVFCLLLRFGVLEEDICVQMGFVLCGGSIKADLNNGVC